MFMLLSSWHSHCESSPGSFDECRLSVGWPPTLRPNQSIWAVSPPIGCYHPQTPSPFIIITQLVSWYSFYRPTEGGRLSRPKYITLSYSWTYYVYVSHRSTYAYIIPWPLWPIPLTSRSIVWSAVWCQFSTVWRHCRVVASGNIWLLRQQHRW